MQRAFGCSAAHRCTAFRRQDCKDTETVRKGYKKFLISDAGLAMLAVLAAVKLWDLGLGWVLPAAICGLLGFLVRGSRGER